MVYDIDIHASLQQMAFLQRKRKFPFSSLCIHDSYDGSRVAFLHIFNQLFPSSATQKDTFTVQLSYQSIPLWTGYCIRYWTIKCFVAGIGSVLP